MSTLYQLQFACFIVTTMMALMLLVSRFQMKWLNKRYEYSRGFICLAMSMLAVHYLLQMNQGFRAKSDEMGAVVNILFYTPVAFLISYATYNIVGERAERKRFLRISVLGYVLILASFLVGFFHTGNLRVGIMLYVMFFLFVLNLLYYIITNFLEMRHRRKKLEEDSGIDLLPYDRYTWSSYMVMCVSVLMLMVGIAYRPLLYVVGPLMLLSLFIFTSSFISFGFNLTPTDSLLVDSEEELPDVVDEDKVQEQVRQVLEEPSEELEFYTDMMGMRYVHLTERLIKQIEDALQIWCDAGGYRDSSANMNTLSNKIRFPREVVSTYFERYLRCTFRAWLSEIRFREVQRMMRENPNTNNDKISSECGFSSHAHLYKIFKAKTGMTPGQWKEAISS